MGGRLEVMRSLLLRILRVAGPFGLGYLLLDGDVRLHDAGNRDRSALILQYHLHFVRWRA